MSHSDPRRPHVCKYEPTGQKMGDRAEVHKCKFCDGLKVVPETIEVVNPYQSDLRT